MVPGWVLTGCRAWRARWCRLQSGIEVAPLALVLALALRALPLVQPALGGHLQYGAAKVRATPGGLGWVRDALAVGGLKIS